VRISLINSKAARGLAITAILWLLVTAFAAVPAKAGGLALSGTFYRQNFEMPQGSSLSSPDIYIVVFNNSDEQFGIRMASDTPPGVELDFSDNDFQLNAGDDKKVEISVEVSPEVVPGEYKLKVSAEAYKEGEGIQLLGAAGQEAELTVTGEAALVEIATVTASGDPVPAMIRLYKQMEEQTFDIGYSETGSLELKIAPGTYTTSAFVAGKQVAEESFTIAADEEKEILLSVKTVYFEGFGIVPHYHKDTGELAMAKIVYAVDNLIDTFPEAEVKLKVNFNGSLLEESTLANFSPLQKGKQELNYTYIPADGWEEGIYTLQLELNIGGETYITSAERSWRQVQ